MDSAVIPGNTRIPESDKNREWYEKTVKELLSRAAVLETEETASAWEYYSRSETTRRDSAHMTIHPTGTPYRVNMLNMRLVKPLAERLIGEFVDNGLRYTVAPISPAAIALQQQGIMRMRAAYNLAPYLQAQAEAFPGVATLGQDLPSSPEGLKRWEKDYRSMDAIIHQRLLDDYLHRGNVMLSLSESFESAIVVGAGFLRLTDEGGMRGHLKPEEWQIVVFDQACRYDLKEATFVGTLKYTKLRELVARYDLSKSDIEKIKAGSSVLLPTTGISIPVKQTLGGEEFALEFDVEFRDNIEVSLVEKDGAHEPSRTLVVGGAAKKKETRGSTWTTTIRKAVLLGNEVLAEYGRKKHYRPRDDAWKSGFNVFGYLHMWKGGKTSGLVMDCLPAMIMGNEAVHKLRTEMSNAIGRVTRITSDSLPDDADLFDVHYIMQALGIKYEKQAQLGANANYASAFSADLGLSNESVAAYMQVIQLSRQLIHDIFGVSPGQLGQGDVARVATDVAMGAARQSSYLTRRLFAGMYAMTEEALSCMMNMRHREAMDDPEKYRYIIGDDGVAFLKSFEDGYQDYGIAVDDSVLNDTARQAIIRAVENGMANGMVSAPDSIRILSMRDPKEVVRHLEDRQAELMAMQQAAREQEAQAAQAATQAGLQREQEKDMAKMQERQIAAQGQVEAAKEAARGTILASEVRRDAVLRTPRG